MYRIVKCTVGVKKRWQPVRASLIKGAFKRKLKVISKEVLGATDQDFEAESLENRSQRAGHQVLGSVKTENKRKRGIIRKTWRKQTPG